MKFLEKLPELLMEDVNDSIFATLRYLTHGMSGIRTAKILNEATRQLISKKECYVEIGTYQGFSLIAAGYQNNVLCYGIDDLSMSDIYRNNILAKQGVRDALNYNLQFNLALNCKFIENDFRKVQFENKSIGVLYIDGKHTYEEVKDTLCWSEPFLANEALIIFDDVTTPGVGKAVLEYANLSDIELVLFMKAPISENEKKYNQGRNLDSNIGNGLAICLKS